MRRINWLILICVFTSVFAWLVSPIEFTQKYLAFSGENLVEGRVWTLITALFVHSDPLHLVGNIVFLYVFGNSLEKELKPGKTLAAFFAGGTISFLASIFVYGPETVMVGASAAIFTLASIVMLVKPLEFSLLFLMPQGLVAILYFIYNIAAVYFNIFDGVAYISHVIGFTVGVPFGMAWSKNWKKNLLITLTLLAVYYILQSYLVPLLMNALSI